ncbi:MAG: hypothetical protein R8G33_09665 [Gammaproteobacteria bacterium]|nr:hypothetical protein [Gammaproteobacteria bacterium]
MNSLSRQALNYLNSSESNDKQARNKLCCLILLFEKDYKSKIDQLDEVLLLHILNHLTECYLESITYLGQEKHSATEHLIKRLTLSDITMGSSRTTVFNRCTYYSRELLGEFNEATNDQNLTILSELEKLKDTTDKEITHDNIPPLQDFTDTECNEIPAPALANIKIESSEPIEKNEQFSSIYTLWNQKYNPAFK